MKKDEVYPVQTIKLTVPEACEAVGRVLIDSSYPNGESVADVSYKIVQSLGVKL